MSEPVYIREIFSSIQGEGLLAGRRQIFVRLADCNLDCRYCDTDFSRSDMCRVETAPGSGRFYDLAQPLALPKVSELLTEWCGRLPGCHHSVSFTGGEPLLSAGSLTEWLPRIREILPVHLETNGTMHIAMQQVRQHVDFVSMDIKLPSTSGCTEHLWQLHRMFLAETSGCTVSVKIVVADATTAEEIHQVCQVIQAVDRSIPLFLQPVTLAAGGVGIAMGHLFRLQERASDLLPDVRVIPQMHYMLGVL